MKSNKPNNHIVQEGETLFVIAQKYGLTLDALIKANPGINPDLINIGQEIKIPDQKGKKRPPSAKTHTIQEGETLFVIAQKYEVTLEALQTANPDLKPDLIHVGQKLNIPDKKRN